MKNVETVGKADIETGGRVAEQGQYISPDKL